MVSQKGVGEGIVWNPQRRKRCRDIEGSCWKQPQSSTAGAYLPLGSNWIRRQRAVSESITLWVQAYQGGRCSDSSGPRELVCDPEAELQECTASSSHPRQQPEQRTQATPSCKLSPWWRQHSYPVFCLGSSLTHVSEQPSPRDGHFTTAQNSAASRGWR